MSRDKKSISIAMCTCNGALYLAKQLESIMAQCHLPDEIVIIDDASDDGTPDILKKYARKFKSLYHVYYNKKRIGSTRNFVKAICRCQGDIIVLCDQDDVWVPEKLVRIKHHFDQNPHLGYVFSDALLVDEKLRSKQKTLWEHFQFDEKLRKKFREGYLKQVEILLKREYITGATLAINCHLKPFILSIPDHWIHDAWMVLLISALGYPGDFIEEQLVHYRIHPQQQIGLGKTEGRGLWGKIQLSLHMEFDPYEVKFDRLKSVMALLNRSDRLPEDTLALFREKLGHIRHRQHLHHLPCWQRIPGVWKGLSKRYYHRFSNGWQSVGKDLFL